MGRKWRFCFIGGVALQRWGEPRFTVDVDLTLLTGFADEEAYVDALLNEYSSRITGAREFALRNRVLLLQSRQGVGIDVALGGLPFEESVVTRATSFVYPPGLSLITCSAEDLVVMKAFAGRGQDWVDVEQIIIRQTGGLDWAYIETQLRPLAEAKEEPEILEHLAEVRRAAET